MPRLRRWRGWRCNGYPKHESRERTTETETFIIEGKLTAQEEAELSDMDAAYTADGRLNMIERVCLELLQSQGLPTGPCRYPAGFANEPWYALRWMGYAPDSKEGFAARMLSNVRRVRRLRAQEDHDGALMEMFFLGAKWASAHIKQGHAEKTRAGPRTQGRDTEMARIFLEKCSRSAGASETKLKIKVGEKFGLKRSAAIEAIDRGLKILSA
jgi:hypothetical protein